MSIHKFINPGQPKEDFFHSSGYAKAATGGALGASSTESFNTRHDINRNRKAVRGYGDSMIGRGHMREVARGDMQNPLRQSESINSRQGFSARGAGMPRRNSVQIPPARPNFREPPTRGYNPFS